MTITLPVDAETERLARKLAQTTGKSLPLIVKEAIEAKAEAVGIGSHDRIGPSSHDLLARMVEITDGFARLPVLDPRTADEIIGYDAHGVPQ